MRVDQQGALKSQEEIVQSSSSEQQRHEGHTQSPGAKDSAFTVNLDNGTFDPSAYLNNSNFLDFRGRMIKL